MSKTQNILDIFIHYLKSRMNQNATFTRSRSLATRFLATAVSIVMVAFYSPNNIAAVAGNGGTGGGMAIACAGDKVYLADTYHIMKDLTLDGLQNLDPHHVQLALGKVLEAMYPEKLYTNPNGTNNKVSVATMLIFIRKSLKYIPSEKPLELLGDDNIDEVTLPKNCNKIQVAIQEIKKHIIWVDLDLIKKMTPLERGLLEFHEQLISLRNQPGLNTAPIRQQIESILKNKLYLFKNFMINLNSDCNLFVKKLKLVHGCLPGTIKDGPGLCERWSNESLTQRTNFIETAENYFEVDDHSNNISAKVRFSPKGQAKILLSSNLYNFRNEINLITHKSSDGEVYSFSSQDTETIYAKLSRTEALQAFVSCNFGLSKLNKMNRAKETEEMNKLGPPAEWEDTRAPSLIDLPKGTTLELIKDLIVQKDVNNSHLTNYFVEMQTNVISVADYLNLYLYKRFALATFFNENNIITPVSYKKGTILVIENIELRRLYNSSSIGFGSTEYILTFKPSDVPNTISRMKVIGRRGGTSDVKIPQFVKLLSEYFIVKKPKR